MSTDIDISCQSGQEIPKKLTQFTSDSAKTKTIPINQIRPIGIVVAGEILPLITE